MGVNAWQDVSPETLEHVAQRMDAHVSEWELLPIKDHQAALQDAAEVFTRLTANGEDSATALDFSLRTAARRAAGGDTASSILERHDRINQSDSRRSTT